MMDGAGDPQTNPWSGWKITGLYNPAVIKKVWIYLTHKGADVKVSGNTAWGEASLGANGTNTWSRDLGFVPQVAAIHDLGVRDGLLSSREYWQSNRVEGHDA